MYQGSVWLPAQDRFQMKSPQESWVLYASLSLGQQWFIYIAVDCNSWVTFIRNCAKFKFIIFSKNNDGNKEVIFLQHCLSLNVNLNFMVKEKVRKCTWPIDECDRRFFPLHWVWAWTLILSVSHHEINLHRPLCTCDAGSQPAVGGAGSARACMDACERSAWSSCKSKMVHAVTGHVTSCLCQWKFELDTLLQAVCAAVCKSKKDV